MRSCNEGSMKSRQHPTGAWAQWGVGKVAQDETSCGESWWHEGLDGEHWSSTYRNSPLANPEKEETRLSSRHPRAFPSPHPKFFLVHTSYRLRPGFHKWVSFETANQIRSKSRLKAIFKEIPVLFFWGSAEISPHRGFSRSDDLQQPNVVAWE